MIFVQNYCKQHFFYALFCGYHSDNLRNIITVIPKYHKMAFFLTQLVTVVRKLFCNCMGVTLLCFIDSFNIAITSIDSCIICMSHIRASFTNVKRSLKYMLNGKVLKKDMLKDMLYHPLPLRKNPLQRKN